MTWSYDRTTFTEGAKSSRLLLVEVLSHNRKLTKDTPSLLKAKQNVYSTSRAKFPQTNLLIAKVLATNLAYLNFVADLVDSDDLNQNFEMIVYRFWEDEQKSVGHRSM